MYVLRHGQSEWNLEFTRTKRDPGIPDAPLTADGMAQAREAGQAMARLGIARIIVSPYTRALQTATAAASELAALIEIDLRVRERFAFSCDIGTPASVLAQDWPAHDFAAVGEAWWPKRRESTAAVLERAAQFRAAARADRLASQPLVVSHWGFILALTGQSLANGEWIEWDPHAAIPDPIVWA